MTESLATKFKDKEFIDANLSKDKHWKHIRTFFLPSKHVKPTLTCKADRCKVRLAAELDESLKLQSEEVQPMCFCFACNQTYHIECEEIGLDCFQEKASGPYLCVDCDTTPLNQIAVNYFQSGNWKSGLTSRRTTFLKGESIQQIPKLLDEQLTEDEFDEEDLKALETLQAKADDMFDSVPLADYKKQQDEFRVMAKKYEELKLASEQKADKHQTQIDKLIAEINEMKISRRDKSPVVATVQEKLPPPKAPPLLTAADILRHNYVESAGKKAKATVSNVKETTQIQNESLSELMSNTNISLTERVLLTTTQAQIDSTNAQRRASDAIILEQRRKALPKMTKFKGDAKGWIRFQKEVQRYKDTGCFDDEAIKMYVLGALEGVALRRVQDMIDIAPLEQVMNVLETSFGHSPAIIKACEDDILKYRLKGELMRNDVVHINSLIQTYFTSCRYAKVSTLNSNMLANHILSQMSSVHKMFFKQHYKVERPNDVTFAPDLDVLFTFLEDVATDLEVRADEVEKRTKSAQVHAVSSDSRFPNVTGRANDNYKYEIRDVATAQYMGYDLTLVNQLTKKCECCGKNGHFMVECTTFKNMNPKQRLDIIASKNICRSCLLTSDHKANSCSIKRGCGYRDGSNRCSQKHHILLHDSSSNYGNRNRNNRSSRRSNTNYNARRANNIVELNASSNQSRQSDSKLQASNAESDKKTVQHNYNSASISNELNVQPRNVGVILSNDRTVKMFKHYILGPKLQIIGHSIGDSGAEITLMRNDLRKALGIDGEPATVRLQWTDGTIKSTSALKVTLELRGLNSDAETLTLDNVYAIDDLNLPPRSLNVEKLKKQFPYLDNVEFESYSNASPSLLIGSPHAACFEAIQPIVENGEGRPIAIKSKLGWSIFGGEPENYPEAPFSVQNIKLSEATVEEDLPPEVTNEELSELLTYFSSIESLGIKPSAQHFTEDELKAMEFILEEMKILPSGSVEVPLLWKRSVNNELPSLPNNYFAVRNRQERHEETLSKCPEKLRAFNENFKELLSEGYVRCATEHDLKSKWPNVWYLPMTLVTNANKLPIKYRNVYDASAKYQGASLNDKLLMGPNFLVDILQPLFKMRMNKIAFTCDVKAMFHRIFISERDQQCQRILWRENINEPMQTYIQQVMLFGPKCSPFTSQYVKNQIAEKWSDKYPQAAETLRKYTYMDDVLSSAPTVESALKIAVQCIEILKSINWDLVGFQSNSIELLKRLPDNHVKQDLIPILTGEIESHATKVLGCVWDTRADCFVFELNKNAFVRIVKEFGHRPTKRDQCSTIARIYDVLGLIAHFIIRGRILVQRSWRNKIGWNQEISEEDNKNWTKWLDDIENIAKLKIPRLYTSYNDMSKAGLIELHVICDAGKEAFAAVAYFVSSFHGFRNSSLVMAKAKVAPLKMKSKMEIHEMPRLELLACLIAARLADTITRLHPNLKLERHLWTDSEVVLRWIKNPNQRLIKFAISPIDEILEKTDRFEWNHIPTHLNSADIATKFQKFDFGDVNSAWFKGPKFLTQPKTCWPKQKEFVPNEEADALLMCNVNVSQIAFTSPVKLPPLDCPLASDTIVDRFDNRIKSNWKKLVRGTARALKIYDAFVEYVKNKAYRDAKLGEEIKIESRWNELEPCDYERAELFIIRKMQQECYVDEYKALKNNRTFINTELNQLNVFMDDQNVIRINSRVELDVEIYPQRFSPLVPRKHPLTRILLYDYHKEFSHIQTESQIAAIRASYWIPQVRAALQSIKQHCNQCRIKSVRPIAPLMAPLPRFRVNPESEPFQTTGVDCTGAITYYKNNRAYKAYVLLFTCTLTRFVHVHLLDNLDTLSVLEAIVQFWADHGPTTRFISDNGTNFVGAARRLRKDQEDITEMLKQQSGVLKQQLAEKYRLSWNFIPPYSPWFGGFYERLIKEVKRSIELTLKNKKPSRKELNIGIQEGVHQINLRPLTHNSLAAEDEEVLTPHLLAKRRSGWPLPSSANTEYNQADKNDRLIYHRGRKIADEITRRFIAQYLPVLTKRTKWLKDNKDIEVGDLVMLIEPNNPRAPYQRAKVIDTSTGRDGHVRVVDVELPDKTTRKKYSVQRVAKLELKRLDDAI